MPCSKPSPLPPTQTARTTIPQATRTLTLTIPLIQTQADPTPHIGHEGDVTTRVRLLAGIRTDEVLPLLHPDIAGTTVIVLARVVVTTLLPDVATLLRQRNLPLARTKVQNLITEDAASTALEILEMHCGVLVERFSELEKGYVCY